MERDVGQLQRASEKRTYDRSDTKVGSSSVTPGAIEQYPRRQGDDESEMIHSVEERGRTGNRIVT